MSAGPGRAIPPPLRFLALVIGGWICIRAAILAPGWWREQIAKPSAAAPSPAASGSGAGAGADASANANLPARAMAPGAIPPAVTSRASAKTEAPAPIHLVRELSYKTEETLSGRLVEERVPVAAPRGPVIREPPPAAAGPVIREPPPSAATTARPTPGGALDSVPVAPVGRRWSASAWVLLRRDEAAPSLAPVGTLGGSQAGGRLLYRVGGGLSLSGRVSVPLRRTQGAELAAGLDWRPVAGIPLNLLAERRQALGRDGRSAFSIAFHGGTSRALAGGVRLDAYLQAGLVGLRSRDAFVDGAVRVSARAGPVEIGGGAWGAAQPGASRLDAGPSLSYALPVAGAQVRLQADWRLRIAGDAAPGSGPAFTLATDF